MQRRALDYKDRLARAIQKQPRFIQAVERREKLEKIRTAATINDKKQLVLFYKWAVTDCFMKYLETLIDNHRPRFADDDCSNEFSESLCLIDEIKSMANDLWLDYVFFNAKKGDNT